MRVAPSAVLKPDDRRSLERWASCRTAPTRLVERARIVLLAADGTRNDSIAKQLHLNVKTVGLWRRRLVDGGLVAIQKDRPRGAPERTVLDTDIEEEVVRRTTQERPTNATPTRCGAPTTYRGARSDRRVTDADRHRLLGGMMTTKRATEARSPTRAPRTIHGAPARRHARLLERASFHGIISGGTPGRRSFRRCFRRPMSTGSGRS